MSMTLSDLRAFVRGYPDIDSQDLPDSVLDVLVREGYNRITRSSQTWRFYQATNTLSVTANQQTYNVKTLWTDPIVNVTQIMGRRWTLQPVPHQVARSKFPAVIATTREPYVWSQYGDLVYLWPSPVSNYTWTLDGYRKPRTIVAAGDVPDLPDEFHELIALHALSRAYSQQDDLWTASFLANQFEDGLAALTPVYTGSQTAAPLVLGGGPNSETIMAGLRFPFE